MRNFRSISKAWVSSGRSFISSRVIPFNSPRNPAKVSVGIRGLLKVVSFQSATIASVAAHSFEGQKNLVANTKLISSFIERCKLDAALELFDGMPIKDVVVWNLMIKGCVSLGYVELGLKLFDEMPERNVISWTTIVDAFLKQGMVEEAKQWFNNMPVKDIAVWNAMIHGMFTNGRVEEARELFQMMPERNTISWTTMISGFDHYGRSEEAVSTFVEMLEAGENLSASTFSCVLTACANMRNPRLGSEVHGHAFKLAYVFESYVVTSLITLYANCSQIENSVKAFEEKLHLDVAVWTSLLTGYSVNSKHHNALGLLRNMFRFGIIPNNSSFTSVLASACEMGYILEGKSFHCAAIKMGLENDSFVGNSLVVLYTRYGSLNDGVLIFNQIRNKNLVSWNSIIAGCAQHGRGDCAVAFFTSMVKAAIHPDEITFIGLLNACSHSGKLQKMRHFFQSLQRCKGIQVKQEHYACVVDVLCRDEKLLEAAEIIRDMPMKPNVPIWLALLSGCRSKFNVELAEFAARNIFDIDPNCTGAYVLLSNIYINAGRWEDAARIMSSMKKTHSIKQPGQSWIIQNISTS